MSEPVAWLYELSDEDGEVWNRTVVFKRKQPFGENLPPGVIVRETPLCACPQAGAVERMGRRK